MQKPKPPDIFSINIFFNLKLGELKKKKTRQVFRNLLTNIFALINYHFLEETLTEMSAYNWKFLSY